MLKIWFDEDKDVYIIIYFYVHSYVDMQLIYANMQHNNVDVQLIYVNMQHDYVDIIMSTLLCCMLTWLRCMLT